LNGTRGSPRQTAPPAGVRDFVNPPARREDSDDRRRHQPPRERRDRERCCREPAQRVERVPQAAWAVSWRRHRLLASAERPQVDGDRRKVGEVVE
jgi:hypothetical protein